MGNINKAGIWTPDERDNMDPQVWSAAMADSIQNGLGERMNKQEQSVSLRATAPVPFNVNSAGPSTPYTVIPLAIASNTNVRAPDPDFSGGNHANGVNLDGGYAKILTAGLYNIVGQITITPGTFAYHSWDFFGTINGSIFGLPDYGVTSASYMGGRVSDVRYLQVGDTIGLTCGVGTDHIGAFRVQDALLALSMVYAT